MSQQTGNIPRGVPLKAYTSNIHFAPQATLTWWVRPTRAYELTPHASREAHRRAQTGSGYLDLVCPFQAREAGMIALDLSRTA